jgi:hypothetical protein
MNISFKKFLISNLIVSVILTTFGWLLFTTVLSGLYRPMFLWLLLFALSINLLIFYIVTRKKYTVGKSPIIIFKSFGIKFFSYVGITLVFFLIEHDFRIRLTYILVLFCLYLTYTFLEITSLTKFFKAEDINSK